MQQIERKIETQLQFWAVLGPFMTVLTLLVCLTKGAGSYYLLSFAGLIGIPLCLCWQRKGLAVGIGLLVVALLSQFTQYTPEQQLWGVGISSAFALALFITAFSLEESSSILEGLKIESKSRLEAMLELDEKYKSSSEHYENEQEELVHRIKNLEGELASKQNRLVDFDTLLEVARKDLTEVYEKNNSILQELTEERANVNKAQRRINELQHHEEAMQAMLAENERLKQELSVSSFTLTEQALEMNASLSEKELLLQNLIQEAQSSRESLEDTAGRLAQVQKELDETKLSKEQLEQTLVLTQQEIQQTKLSKEQLEQSVAMTRQEIDEIKLSKEQAEKSLEDIAGRLTQVNEELQELRLKKEQAPTVKKETAAYRRLQGMYQQLKVQFEEKCEVLDETRRALFHMQERLFTSQRELDDIQRIDKSENQRAYEQLMAEQSKLEKEYQEEIEALQSIVTALSTAR